MVYDSDNELWNSYGVSKSDVLAWLEKQGKQKSIDDLTPQEAMDIAVAKCFEQGEQNSVMEMKTAEESLGMDSDTYNKIVDECIFGEQEPEENKGNLGGISANWSEEDDKVRTTIINEFEQCSEWCCANGLTKEDCIDWLQLLKNRVQPQPKQEWNEEDECYMTECINAIATKDSWSFEEKRKTKHWVKSLKQRIGG